MSWRHGKALSSNPSTTQTHTKNKTKALLPVAFVQPKDYAQMFYFPLAVHLFSVHLNKSLLCVASVGLWLSQKSERVQLEYTSAEIHFLFTCKLISAIPRMFWKGQYVL
jgi:hypothetical protein